MSKTKNEIDLIDITELGAEELQHDVPLVFSEEDGSPIAGLKIVDANSRRYRDAKRLQDVNSVKSASIRRKAIDGKSDEGAAALLDMGESQKLALVKACVVGIYGFKSGGKPAEATDEVLSKIFAAKPTWADKVAEKINEVSGFLTRPATS